MNNKIVIGTWPTSGDWGPNNISETIELYTKSFFEYGFKEYDTAPNYGNGFSEFILGKIFYNQNGGISSMSLIISCLPVIFTFSLLGNKPLISSKDCF